MDEVTTGTFLRAKQTVTVAVDFLLWLAERDTPLDQLTHADLDE